LDRREGPFDPSQFDRYEQALKTLIADKQKGSKVTAPRPALARRPSSIHTLRM